VKLVHLTRVYRFCAGHRLHRPDRSDEWNLHAFGKCSYPGGHGHNYTLEVTVRGEPDPATGLVLPGRTLDEAVAAEVFERIDHRSLNEVLSRDFGPTPTTEVLILELWRALEPRIPTPAKLHRLRIRETAKNTFECLGGSPGQTPDERIRGKTL